MWCHNRFSVDKFAEFVYRLIEHVVYEAVTLLITFHARLIMLIAIT